jgi:lysozyme
MLGIALAVYAGWRYLTAWAPSRDEYPVQGIVVTEHNGHPNWAELGATGVDFAYITAVEGARTRDAEFQANLAGEQDAGIRFGAARACQRTVQRTRQCAEMIISARGARCWRERA